MKKHLHFATLGLLVALLAVQFVPPPRNAGAAEGTASIVTIHPVPDEVRKILARSCYDCHSNTTRYPWYAAVQPVGWWLNRHVAEGKAHLNFSEFAAYDPKHAVRKLRQVSDEVTGRSMPLKSYLWMHGEARLTGPDIALLARWADDLADTLEAP